MSHDIEWRMRDAPVKFVAGRVAGTVAAFRGNFGRVVVPGIADVLFKLEDAIMHNRSFRDPARPNILSVLTIEGLGGYLLSFLDPRDRDRVFATACWLLDNTIIPLSIVRVVEQEAPRGASFFNQQAGYGPCISIDLVDACAKLELPTRPDAWAHFKLPRAWAVCINNETKRTRNIRLRQLFVRWAGKHADGNSIALPALKRELDE
jgi:hypothetical protein